MDGSRKNTVKRPIVELIEELKTKIALLEGDRRAYYESSYFTMQRNRDRIAALRKELYDLRRRLRERIYTDDSVISQAFQNRPIEKSAFQKKSSQQAILEMDFRVSDTMKRYNQTKYVTHMKRRRLEELRIELVNTASEQDTIIAESAMETLESQRIRDMENRMDKLNLKCNEADFIHQTYAQIHDRLYNEHVHANHVLDEMETDIRRCKAEKEDLMVMHADAMQGKELTLVELRRLEEYVYADRKRRELEVARMRRVAEEHKLQNERVEKRAVDEAMDDRKDDKVDEFDDMEEKEGRKSEMSEDTTALFEKNMVKLRNITGIPDMHGVVSRFESQMDVKHKLITLINAIEAKINRARHDRSKNQEELHNLKSSLEVKTNKNLEVKAGLKAEINERNSNMLSTTEEYNRISHFLVDAKAGLEHLMEKLMHLKTKEKIEYSKPNSAEEYILDIFKRIRMKIQTLLKDLSKYNIEEYLKMLRQEEKILVVHSLEFESHLQRKVTPHNIRIKAEVVLGGVEVDDESGDDNPDFKSRVQMMEDSAILIEMKTKKKRRKKRK